MHYSGAEQGGSQFFNLYPLAMRLASHEGGNAAAFKAWWTTHAVGN